MRGRIPIHATVDARLLEELRQLLGLRRLRRRVYGPDDQEIRHLDAMIQQRRTALIGAEESA